MTVSHFLVSISWSYKVGPFYVIDYFCDENFNDLSTFWQLAEWYWKEEFDQITLKHVISYYSMSAIKSNIRMDKLEFTIQIRKVY